MTDEKPSEREPQPESRKKENNPFSEQEKHGDQAQRQVPAFQQEYQGGQPEADQQGRPGKDLGRVASHTPAGGLFVKRRQRPVLSAPIFPMAIFPWQWFVPATAASP